MLRRQFLVGASALALTACTGGEGTVTVQQIIDDLKKNCEFTTSVESVVSVILTVLSTFNASAGAAATVAASVAKAVVDAICNAVKAQVSQTKAEAKAKGTAAEAPKVIRVIVNGKEIVGEYTGK